MLRAKWLLMIGLGVFSGSAFGQQATERYIPVGASPGVSGMSSMRGSISALDARARTITVEDAQGTHVIRLTDRTRIWIDRSESNASNVSATYEDCRVGQAVEVKFMDPVARTVADWVKIDGDPR